MGKILSQCQGITGAVSTILYPQLAEQLIEEGQRLVNLAYENRTFQNRTWNLACSYGSTLYINGREYTGPADFYNYFKKIAGADGGESWASRSGFAPGTTETQKRVDNHYARRYPDATRGVMPRTDDAHGMRGRGNKTLSQYYADEWDGGKALDKFFIEYPAPKGKWHLVVVAAMFYGAILEKKWDYKVITHIESEMTILAPQLNGCVKTYDKYEGGILS